MPDFWIDTAESVVDVVISNMQGRKGFDAWYHEIDSNVRNEMIADIVGDVATRLEELVG